MRRLIYTLMLLTGALLAFVGYCAALIDWIQEYSSGYYTDHRIEQGLETAGIVIYTYWGIRFCRKNMNSLQ